MQGLGFSPAVKGMRHGADYGMTHATLSLYGHILFILQSL